MNIFETVKEGLRVARTSRALWLYGFFAGLAMLRAGHHKHVESLPTVAHAAAQPLTPATMLLLVLIIAVIGVGVFLYFVSAGALIGGVTQVRRGGSPTVRTGWLNGLAHWGVLLRITGVYLATSAGAVLLLATPFLIALKVSGSALAAVFAAPAVVIAVPLLLTLYVWQSFALRIAVIENRRASDAIAKARLFLHGRLFRGLKLIVAATLARLVVLAAGAIGVGAVVLALVGVLSLTGMLHATLPVVALGALVLLPAVFMLVAISGTAQSSIWTIGFLAEQDR